MLLAQKAKRSLVHLLGGIETSNGSQDKNWNGLNFVGFVCAMFTQSQSTTLERSNYRSVDSLTWGCLVRNANAMYYEGERLVWTSFGEWLQRTVLDRSRNGMVWVQNERTGTVMERLGQNNEQNGKRTERFRPKNKNRPS